MVEVEKQAELLLKQNLKFIKGKTPLSKDPLIIYQVAEHFLSNSFIYMLLNRRHRKKIKFETTRFLDEAVKNINYFFIAWEKVINKTDIYEPDNKRIEHPLKNEEIIKNFYNLGIAIDQLLFLIGNSKNYWQVVSFKKKNLSLIFALSNMKDIYTHADPGHEESQFYKTFISILKEEMLESVNLEWKKLSTNTHKQINPIEINDLITFTQYCEKIMFHFMENSTADTLRKQVEDFKKYLIKMTKFKKQ